MTDKKIISSAMPTPDDDITSSRPKKIKKLKLDTKGYKPPKSRAELYQEMLDAEKKLDEDVFELSSYVSRSIALGVDLIFDVAIIYIALLLSPYEMIVLQKILGVYKIEFIFTPETTMQLFDFFNIFIAVFLGILIPVSFFNSSLGKKLTKLRVRGDQNYTISLSKAMRRELIFKPISMILIVGFILPFFDKDQKSLHDKLAGTIVIRD